MPVFRHLGLVLLLGLAGLVVHATTAFTYQGVLALDGVATQGAFDFEFALYDAASGGTQVGTTVVLPAVPVTNGQFTATLDFGALVFPGTTRWLRVAVRPAGATGAFAAMSPRQPITAAPFAITAQRALSADTLGGLAPSAFAPATHTHAAGNITGVLGIAQGGTGVSTAPIAGQFLLGTSAGAFTLGTLTGTANRVLVAQGTGSITLSLPQDIHTGAKPTFAGLTLTSPLVSQVAAGTAPITVTSTTMVSNLNAHYLGGFDSGHFKNAGNLSSGILHPDRFSAYADLVAEGAIGTTATQVAAGDHAHHGVYAPVQHDHDSRYVRLGQEGSIGTAMLAGGAVTLDKLSPSGAIAGQILKYNGVAWYPTAERTYAADTGLVLKGSVFSLAFVGNGSLPYAARSDHHHDGAYFKQGGNAFGAVGVLGTADDQALEFRVNNTRAWRIEPHATAPNIVGGHSANTVTAGVYGATISGGGSVLHPNQVTAHRGTVSGGWGNTSGHFATVGGGEGNTASGYYATVGGGWSNEAGGEHACVPGGFYNTAKGGFSFAAGRQARANHLGSFVWGDATTADVASTGDNQFIIRASGGVGIGLTDPETALDVYGVIRSRTGGIRFPDGTNQTTAATISFAGTGSAPTIARSDHHHDARYFKQGGNALGAAGVLGTTDNQALEFRVNSARALRIEPSATSPNVIAGHSLNEVRDGTHGAAITGGGKVDKPNRVTSDYSTVAGGIGNTAGGQASFVGAGGMNGATGDYSAVVGGSGNIASADYATVVGGTSNSATWFNAFVGGGHANTASGNCAVVTGGADNKAVGDYSFAAGLRAKANHHGSFVWADSTLADHASQRDNQFRVRAAGGVLLDLNNGGWVNFWVSNTPVRLIDTSSGAYLSTGGTWTNSSDRALKAGFAPVDSRAVLRKVADLPLTTWHYTAEGTDVRHLGPMAQDFRAAFGLGADETSISTVDASGVALAAIQGLHVENAELRATVAAQQEELAALKAALAALTVRVEGLR